MAKYLITGASGWLGANLLSVLLKTSGDPNRGLVDAGLEITCLCLPDELDEKRTFYPSNVSWVPGNLKTGEGLDGFFSNSSGAVLIHLAGLIHPRMLSRDFRLVNVEGTKRLMEMAKINGIRKSIVMSSNSPLGCNLSMNHVFTEESPYNPYLGYGRSKYLMEVYLRDLMSSNKYFPIVIIRAPWFYGPFQPERQKQFFKMIEKGKFPIMGNGRQRRSMVYTENLCQGILLAMDNEAANNEIFWIADKNPYSMNEITSTIKDLLVNEFGVDCNQSELRMPSFLSDIAYFGDFILQFSGLYSQKIHVMSEMNKTIACSIDKSEQVLGYKPKYALREGMYRSLSEIYR
ncbi:NAD(P)-dependent oxidoreductase [Gammaproteobacteria bacterium]|nr:NAD(P)-dependent oxidoreductase [Gammaproteobacteria bacterium]